MSSVQVYIEPEAPPVRFIPRRFVADGSCLWKVLRTAGGSNVNRNPLSAWDAGFSGLMFEQGGHRLTLGDFVQTYFSFRSHIALRRDSTRYHAFVRQLNADRGAGRAHEARELLAAVAEHGFERGFQWEPPKSSVSEEWVRDASAVAGNVRGMPLLVPADCGLPVEPETRRLFDPDPLRAPAESRVPLPSNCLFNMSIMPPMFHALYTVIRDALAMILEVSPPSKPRQRFFAILSRTTASEGDKNIARNGTTIVRLCSVAAHILEPVLHEQPATRFFSPLLRLLLFLWQYYTSEFPHSSSSQAAMHVATHVAQQMFTLLAALTHKMKAHVQQIHYPMVFIDAPLHDLASSGDAPAAYNEGVFEQNLSVSRSVERAKHSTAPLFAEFDESWEADFYRELEVHNSKSRHSKSPFITFNQNIMLSNCLQRLKFPGAPPHQSAVARVNVPPALWQSGLRFKLRALRSPVARLALPSGTRRLSSFHHVRPRQ